MAKSKELKDYDEKQWQQMQNEEYPDRPYWVKYDNFILDIRKPSFIWFLVFLGMSIIGIVQSIKFIIMLFT